MNSNAYSDTAVLIPCYNEEVTIGKVVSDFRAILPGARIYVFDNNSTDRTSQVAKQHGAIVIPSPRQGKGNVVRHMFNSVDADVYIMVDGDDTYPASAAPKLIGELRSSGVDMVVGARIPKRSENAFRMFHKFGNRLITQLIATLFQIRVTDVLSGYRAFSRALVKSLPLTSEEFEIETELTLQTATKGFSLKEVPVDYGARPAGSFSKLSTFTDGFLILKAISFIFKDYKPLLFFSTISVFFALASFIVGMTPILDYYRSGYVYHVPLAILAAALGILAVLFLGVGLILDSTFKYHAEAFELWKRQMKNQLGNKE